MKLHKHFLQQDMVQASKEYHSYKDLLAIVDRELDRGDIESAKHRATDMLLSLQELSKLSYKKYNLERQNKLMEQMGAAGISIQLVRGHFLDRQNS